MIDILTYNGLLDIGENEQENDHAMDDIRYFANTIMKNKVGKATSNYTPIFM